MPIGSGSISGAGIGEEAALESVEVTGDFVISWNLYNAVPSETIVFKWDIFNRVSADPIELIWHLCNEISAEELELIWDVERIIELPDHSRFYRLFSGQRIYIYKKE